MRPALRIIAVVCLAAGLHFFVRSQLGGAPTAAEKAAYRDWAANKAEQEVREWDEYYATADPNNQHNYDLEPYADPTLYALGTAVIQAGETWRGEIELLLPGGSENSGSSAIGSYRQDPRIHVVRNEWQDLGVKVEIEDVWVDSYVYPTWRIRDGQSEYTLRSIWPLYEARTMGGFTREQIARLQADGARFNVDAFDAGFDMSRGEGSGWRAQVRYRISVPAEFPASKSDRSCIGQLTIAAGVGGRPYKAHLIHLEDHEGVAFRPWRQ